MNEEGGEKKKHREYSRKESGLLTLLTPKVRQCWIWCIHEYKSLEFIDEEGMKHHLLQESEGL